MDVQSIIQEAASVANALSVVVLAVGYYFLIKLYREWIHQNKERHIAGGRPMVVVSASYAHLPNVNIKVRNFNNAPAKEISFAFSALIEDSNGFVISASGRDCLTSNPTARSAFCGTPCRIWHRY